jgi:hypothetical protein
LVLFGVVSGLALHVVIWGNLEFVASVALVELLLVVEDALDRPAHILVQLSDQQLLLLVFLNSLSYK